MIRSPPTDRVYVVHMACFWVLGATSIPAVGTRVLCSLCLLAFAISFWINTKPYVLRMLVVRPRYAQLMRTEACADLWRARMCACMRRNSDAAIRRVVYFTGSVLLRESLNVAMVRNSEPISEALIAFSSAVALVAIPFFDAMPQSTIGPTLLRIVHSISSMCMHSPRFLSE